jgi:hypothetical protein
MEISFVHLSHGRLFAYIPALTFLPVIYLIAQLFTVVTVERIETKSDFM